MPIAPTDKPPLWLDAENQCLWRGAERLVLPPKAYALLSHLSDHPKRLVTKRELLDAVWPGTFVGDAVLKVNIKQIRDIVGDDARQPWLIETVHRRGYRLMAELPRTRLETAIGTVPLNEPRIASVVASWLVGRDEARARLWSAWQRALKGQRQLVFVTGEPGIGKTALVESFFAQLATASAPPQIGRGHCLEDYGATEAYLPVLDAVEDLLRTPAGQGITPHLRRYAPTWLARLPWLLEPGQVPASDPAAGGASRERMLREIATTLEMASSERPLVLLLEDLHWSDPSTVTLLAYLGQRQQAARLLVIGTYRPVDLIVGNHPLKEIKQTLQTRRQCEEIPLWYLGGDDIRAYLEARLGGTVDAELAMAVERRTSGNPLFVVSVVDHLVEAQLIDSVDGAWRASGGKAAPDVVPNGLRPAIERRLERLDAREYAVLEAASVAGSEFHTMAVAAALATAAEDVEAVCEGLGRRGDLLRATGATVLADGEVSGRYEFQHALFQNVLYERASTARRMEMHRRIGEWAEEHAAGPGELAFHFARCGTDANARKAASFATRAAQRATAVFAYDEAVSHCETALRTAATLAVRDPRLEVELLVGLAEVRQRAGQIVAADSAFRESAAAAKKVGDAVLLARAAIGIGHGYQRIGQPDPELIELLEAALAAFGSGDHPFKALTMAHLDYALGSVPGSLARRSILAQEALAMARRVGGVEIQAWVLQYTRWAFRGPQTEQERRDGLAEIEALLPQAGDAELELMLRHILVTDLLELGELPRARCEADELLQRAKEAQLPWVLWLVGRLRTALALFEGRFADAEQLIAETLEYGQATDHPNVVPMAGAQWALLALETGRLDDVGALVEIAIAENPRVLTWRALAALVAAERGQIDVAAAQLAQVAEDDFAHVPQDTAWLLAMGFAAAAAAAVGDQRIGRKLYDALLPYRDRCTGMGSAILSLGHPERYIGLAAIAAGMDCAAQHLTHALRENERMGAVPWAALTRRDLARLRESDDSESSDPSDSSDEF